MNAVEAKQLSKSNKRTPLEREYLRTHAKIEEAAKTGEFCIYLPCIDPVVRVCLAAEGYIITDSELDNGTYVNW